MIYERSLRVPLKESRVFRFIRAGKQKSAIQFPSISADTAFDVKTKKISYDIGLNPLYKMSLPLLNGKDFLFVSRVILATSANAFG